MEDEEVNRECFFLVFQDTEIFVQSVVLNTILPINTLHNGSVRQN